MTRKFPLLFSLLRVVVEKKSKELFISLLVFKVFPEGPEASRKEEREREPPAETIFSFVFGPSIDLFGFVEENQPKKQEEDWAAGKWYASTKPHSFSPSRPYQFLLFFLLHVDWKTKRLTGRLSCFFFLLFD